MFISKRRSIVIPQLEHARFSGHLAQVWGNDTIDAPPVDHARFTAGVTHHDRGYNSLDNMPIGGVDESVWLATQRRGILAQLADPIADTVALLHVRRLVAGGESDTARELVALADERIAANIAQTDYTRADFARADRITNLCDMISFDFCFEAPIQRTLPVYSQAADDLIEIQVTLADDGHITLDPYPLAVPQLRGFILGYEQTGYPDHPRPVLVEYTVSPLAPA